jgi:hypothetical protein
MRSVRSGCDVPEFFLGCFVGLVVGFTLASVTACQVARGVRAANTERLGGVLTVTGGYRAKRGVDPSLVIPPRGASPVSLKVVRR